MLSVPSFIYVILNVCVCVYVGGCVVHDGRREGQELLINSCGVKH